MRNSLPIAVSVAVSMDAVMDGSMERSITSIGASRARYIEFRVDREIQGCGLDDAAREMLDSLVYWSEKAGLESILTCRVAHEGGSYLPASEASHLEILHAMIEARPSFVDVELASSMTILEQVFTACEARFVRPIISRHDFQATPTLNELHVKVPAITGKLASIPGLVKENMVLKLVFTATRAEDNLVPLQLVDLLAMDDWTGTCFCMGPAGWLSRITCVIPRKGERAASFMTYASLDEALAPGQLRASLVETMLACFS